MVKQEVMMTTMIKHLVMQQEVSVILEDLGMVVDRKCSIFMGKDDEGTDGHLS